MTGAGVLREGAARIGVNLSEAQQDKLAQFAHLIRKWNTVMNLVSREDVPRIEVRHLLDALTFSAHLRGRRVADIGTGAGLPGLPLAIVRKDLEFSLIDRSAKRAGFVRQVAIELGLDNVVEVMTSDIARFRPRTGFDTVVARALAQPGRTWQLSRPLLAAGGRAVFAAGAEVAAPNGADIVAASYPVQLPGIERRHQLIVVDLIDSASWSAEHA